MNKETTDQLSTQLLQFLDHSPTAWHAVSNCRQELVKAGFKEINEDEQWKLKAGGRYFVTRNGSSICAFSLPESPPKEVRVAASHTDSPSFKLKPHAEFIKENMTMLGLEVYGAPLITSWLNRDLCIAGRLVFTDTKGETCEALVHLNEHPVVIPQLAIHLDRNVNDSGPVLNKQEHLAALAGITDKKTASSFLERSLKKAIPLKTLLAYDLFLVPVEPASLIGENRELIASYRIDSLMSVYAALRGLLEQKPSNRERIQMVVFWDNEEIGSHTAQGAASPFFTQTLERVCAGLNLSRDDYFRLLSRSLCASVDLGHAFHPGYPEKHEPRHLALLNQGIIIKTNAQHRYASDARSSAEIVRLCHEHNIPLQHYVTRGDIPCGSTVGPIHAQLTGMPTVDIGIAQLSMHSCRELASYKDFTYLNQLLKCFF
ncbi:MAG: M18 family aminopeptidase [Parachlamydiaceae bacterium]